MPTATPSSASASAWSGLSIVDNTASQLRHRVVLNNSLAADHTVAGLDNNQQLGDTIDLVNRGTKNLTLNAEDTTAAAKDRFTSAVFVPAGGKVRLYYTKMVQFAETATGLTHTGTVPIPAGAILLGIDVIPQVLWGGGTVAMNVGDSASGTGYFSGINLKATDALVGEVFDTNASELWGGKQGAYLVAATGQRGPTASNFGKLYVAGSNIVGVITVTTPAVNTGRTTMVVRYCIPQAIAPVVV
jgi:hypothetical protein